MKKVLVALAVIAGQVAFGQVQNQMQMLQSPNVASLGAFGKIDITPFNGLADIGVDVFDVSEGDISIKARLSCYSGGVKPNSHPGWVGTNWSLNVGGVVTRQVNGAVDEVYAAPPNTNAFAYLYHHDILAPSNWNTSNFVSANWLTTVALILK